jgi:hypothetical protein
VLWAQGRHGFDGVMGSGTLWGRRCRGLGQDDGTVGSGTTWVDNVVGSGTALGAQHRGLREDNIVVGSRTVSQAWGQCVRGRRHH